MISSDWNLQQISKAELEKAFEPNIIEEWAISFSSLFYFQKRQAIKSLLFKNGLFLFVSLLLVFPIILISSRSLGLAVNSSLGFLLILTIGFLSSALLLVILYCYLYKQAKRVKNITALLNKVEQYNQLIHSFGLLANISAIASNKTDTNSAKTTELQSILNLTKNTLLESIKLESYIYRHHNQRDISNYPCNPQQLLAQLEDNLVNIPFSQEQNTEYQQLLEESIDIGLSVQQEMRKIWNLRQNN